ncbi:MAG: transcriptional regulator [Longimonas sp.]|uniref:GbsR/MarR family transcriptional regulator n=1 Tax=Longimonas sp. TaxID=2039626 RepID=UPI00397689A1
MAHAPSPVEEELIQEFGNIYESHGLKRLQGLIVGLLLTQSEPASLDDMVELLGHSKGPISISVRRLADMGVVRKVDGPVNRRNYYVAHPDIFYNNFKFNMATVRRNRSLAERYLRRMEQNNLGDAETIKNLEHMHAFYQLMESFYQDFSERWAEVKQSRLDDQDAATASHKSTGDANL